VAIDTVNFVWTFGFFGFLVGSLLTGFVFKQYIRSDVGKLIFLFSTIFLTGIFVIVLPLTSSFPLLVTGRLIQHTALGAFITADASLIVFLIGPEKSRPFTMLIHAVIGVGFLSTSLLVRPFLPNDEDIDKETICSRDSANTSSLETGILSNTTSLLYNQAGEFIVPTIAWPFIISGSWCIVFSFGFLILACIPQKMPRYYEYEPGTKQEAAQGKTIKNLPIFFTVVFLFYFVSCGIERIYQPMASTFGLCGPLDLSPTEAVATDSFYNGGFMVGRLVSAVVAGLVSPRNMILTSLGFCVAAAVLLCALAGTSMYGLYAGTAFLGFFVSWQFGSCFSWVAKKVNVTGRLSSLFFIGCGAGSLATPPLAGFIFTSSLGPMSIIYMTLGFCLLQCLLFFAMWILSRNTTTTLTSYSLHQFETRPPR